MSAPCASDSTWIEYGGMVGGLRTHRTALSAFGFDG